MRPRRAATRRAARRCASDSRPRESDSTSPTSSGAAARAASMSPVRATQWMSAGPAASRRRIAGSIEPEPARPRGGRRFRVDRDDLEIGPVPERHEPVVRAHERVLPAGHRGHARARLEPPRALLQRAPRPPPDGRGEAHAIVMPSLAMTRFTAGRARTRSTSAGVVREVLHREGVAVAPAVEDERGRRRRPRSARRPPISCPATRRSISFRQSAERLAPLGLHRLDARRALRRSARAGRCARRPGARCRRARP